MSDVDDYLAAVPEPQRTTLEAVRRMLRDLLPGADEVIAYGIPCFKVDGLGVAGLGSTRTHCAYYPMSGSVTAELADELTGYVTSKGSVRFGPEEPLPRELLLSLVEARQRGVARSRA